MAEQRQTRMAASRMAGPRPPAAVRTGVPALTPKDILGILRRHVLLIVSLTFLGFIVGGVSWYFSMRYTPKYTAQTYIRVLQPVVRDPMTIGGAMANKDIQYGHRLSMVDLIRQQSTLQRLLARDRIRETKWFERFGKRIKWFKWFGRGEEVGESEAVKLTKAFKDLEGNFRAYARRDAEFMVVSMTCGDRKEAALIVNEMVDLFLASQVSTKKGELNVKLSKLEEQRVRVQGDLDLANRALDAVRTRYGFTDLEERRFEHVITQKLNDLEAQQNDLVMEIRQVQTITENLSVLAEGPITEQVEHQIESDPVMILLAEQLALQEAMLASRLTKFGENHKVVRAARGLMNKTREERELRRMKIAEQTRLANLKNAQDQLVVLESRLAELERMRQEAAVKKKDLDLARVQYGQRVTIRDEREQTLNSVKEQMDKLRIMLEDPETPKVQRVGPAPEPLEVSSPRWELYFPGGTMLGFLLGVGIAFLAELLNDLVRTPRDVGRFLHIPLLGVIPDAAEDEQVRGVDLCRVVRQAPYSIISESYRRFRSNLKLSGSVESLKALLISSGMAGDGKTSVVVNLAMTFVAENKKVLLIDANFWRPSLHTIFPKPSVEGEAEAGERSEFGLSTLLAGLCGYQEVIRPSGIEDFDVIDSGPLPTNPAELLGGEQMQQLIKHQRQSYDYVIVDGPPVLLVSDVKVLARLVDGTVLVFNAGATRRGAALRTIRELREVNATIVGCVLFAVKAMKGGYFHEQFRSYQEYQKLQLELAHSV